MKYVTFLFVVLSVLIPSTTTARSTNIPIPFTPQAPYGIWVEPWSLACEEAVTVMISAYYAGEKSLTKLQARDRILAMVQRENWFFGYNDDTSAAETGHFINLFYSWETEVVKYPSIAQIRTELDAGRPVIVPVNVAEIKNRHFRNNGPGYHLLFLSGYDDETKEFISQEPGTRHGANYRYSYNTLIRANHEYVPGQDIERGEPIMVFTRPTATSLSLLTDGDNDGWTKAEELARGTSLMKKDPK